MKTRLIKNIILLIDYHIVIQKIIKLLYQIKLNYRNSLIIVSLNSIKIKAYTIIHNKKMNKTKIIGKINL
jgi:hypothetical protein